MQNPSHKYIDNGYYTIFLNITDNLGGINGISKNINILNNEPSVDFSYSPSLPNDLDNIIFNDKSLIQMDLLSHGNGISTMTIYPMRIMFLIIILIMAYIL